MDMDMDMDKGMGIDTDKEWTLNEKDCAWNDHRMDMDIDMKMNVT